MAAPPEAKPEAQPPPSEVSELRAEVKALREELSRVVGTSVAQPDERERLLAELAEEKQKLASLEASVAGGAERSAVADSIARAEARIAEIETALARLPPVAAPPLPSKPVDELERGEPAPAPPKAPPPPAAAPETATDGGDHLEKMGLLPLEFTAFGDFFYRLERLRR